MDQWLKSACLLFWGKNDIIDIILSNSKLNFPLRNPFPTKTKEILNVLCLFRCYDKRAYAFSGQNEIWNTIPTWL